MRTVKELSDVTGISVRTLHYYDEIGLLAPTRKSEAGYRLYDDKALETLQQILFFREFDIPLKDIKSVMENPALDRTRILQMQRKMLTAKKEHMPEEIRQTAINEFGSIEQWKQHYLEVTSSEKMQKNYAKVVEWYGGKEAYLSVVKNPVSKEVAESYNKRIEAILQKLYDKRDCPVDSFEVKEIVGEYGFAMKQFSQIKDERELMLANVRFYRNESYKTNLDQKYGEGAAAFFALAIETFYSEN